ncbi:partitioning defective 3 homolog isoform X2 [Tachypleus tridentatus]|uniref:partitioning defective 3 homolog isoform X2 n=1 Tax=Tachypleus tridentatus TaxID=6853 RepID=UPI003FD19F62
MKVTVNFGDVGVIVPCGDGNILVRDLMKLAITRYKKASAKATDSWVTILKLKSSNDGGILDPDDQLNDVADDREQVIAIYEEHPLSRPPHNNGDGTSASSAGTGSPDIFNGDKADSVQEDPESGNDIDVEITAAHISTGTSVLQVRRGSEPALNCLEPSEAETVIEPSLTTPGTLVKQVLEDSCSKYPDYFEESLGEPESMPFENNMATEEERSDFLCFEIHSSARMSMLGNSIEASRWEEAAQKQLEQMKNLERKEPVGGPITMTSLSQEDSVGDNEKTITLKNEPGPLGIHVVPEHDSCGRDTGLIVQGVEPGSRVDRDGRLQVSDRIVQINEQSLVHVSFQKAQEIFKNALKDPEIRIRLRKGSESSSKGIMSPLEKENVSSLEKANLHDKTVEEETVKEQKNADNLFIPSSKGQPITLGQKNLLLTSNTTKIGRKLQVKLAKGPDGLGFSITTRDNPARGYCPIYIKNILPKGAAIQDGRLMAGDRLLQVNEIEMTGLSQAEAAAILRNISPGSIVTLIVSRQDVDALINPNLPRQLPPEKAGDGVGIYPWQHKEVLTFDIPLNDTGSAGLGVSVKGRTSMNPTGPVDLGIFVKSVIHGGAASKDGRLMANDQLLSINGISLLNMTNTEAMRTLRRAMIGGEGQSTVPDTISLKIARRISSPSIGETGDESQISTGSNHLNDSVFSSESDSRCKSPEGQNISIKKDTKASGVNMVKNKEEGQSKNFRAIPIPKSSSDFDENMNQRENKIIDKKNIIFDPLLAGKNPVIARLTGQGPHTQTNRGSVLRNESYLRASHESWGGNQLYQAIYGHTKPAGHIYNDYVLSPTVNMPSSSSVMIEDEYPKPNQQMRSKSRPGTPENFLSTSDSKKDTLKENSEETKTSEINNKTNHIPPDEEDSFSLSRDGFGRQSVSEKRNTQLDTHNTDTLQRNKRTKEEKEKQKQAFKNQQEKLEKQQQTEDQQFNLQKWEDSASSQYSQYREQPDALSSQRHMIIKKVPLQVGPFLGMRKSSSLESLQTVMQELKREETYISSNNNTNGRGTKNEHSPSTADRSFEGTLEMDTQDEESESGSLISVESHGCAPLVSVLNRSSGSNDHILEEVLSPHRKSSKRSKKKGLWKGLGSVFKVGKNKKPQGSTKLAQDHELEVEERTRKVAQEQQEKALKQYKELVDRDRKSHAIYGSARFPSTSPFSTRSTLVSEQYQERQERLQQLHAEHQKRRGHYVKDEMEELYEKEIRAALARQPPRRPLPPPPPVYAQFCQPRRVLPKKHETDSLHSKPCSSEKPNENKSTAKLDLTALDHYKNSSELHYHLQQQGLRSSEQQPPQRHHTTAPPLNLASLPPELRQDRDFSRYYDINGKQTKSVSTSGGSQIPSQTVKKPSPPPYDHPHYQTLQPQMYGTTKQKAVQNVSYLDRQLLHNSSLGKGPLLMNSIYSLSSCKDTRAGDSNV